MSLPAQVRSVEAIERFRVQLAKFERQVQDALESLTAETRRASQWLEYDRPSYWQGQTRLAEAGVHQAKLELERCLVFPIAGEYPACREQRAVLKKAQARLEYCRDKSERVRHWKRQMQHEMFEYDGRLGQLRRLLETELPAARASLRQIVRRLDAYQIQRPPQSSEFPTAGVRTDRPDQQNPPTREE